MSRTEQRHQLLELLGDKISEPERTDFNLDRWLEAYDEVNGVFIYAGFYLSKRTYPIEWKKFYKISIIH